MWLIAEVKWSTTKHWKQTTNSQNEQFPNNPRLKSVHPSSLGNELIGNQDQFTNRLLNRKVGQSCNKYWAISTAGENQCSFIAFATDLACYLQLIIQAAPLKIFNSCKFQCRWIIAQDLTKDQLRPQSLDPDFKRLSIETCPHLGFGFSPLENGATSKIQIHV